MLREVGFDTGTNIGEQKCSFETCRTLGYTVEECYSNSSKDCISMSCCFGRVCKGWKL